MLPHGTSCNYSLPCNKTLVNATPTCVLTLLFRGWRAWTSWPIARPELLVGCVWSKHRINHLLVVLEHVRWQVNETYLLWQILRDTRLCFLMGHLRDEVSWIGKKMADTFKIITLFNTRFKNKLDSLGNQLDKSALNFFKSIDFQCKYLTNY